MGDAAFKFNKHTHGSIRHSTKYRLMFLFYFFFYIFVYRETLYAYICVASLIFVNTIYDLFACLFFNVYVNMNSTLELNICDVVNRECKNCTHNYFQLLLLLLTLCFRTIVRFKQQNISGDNAKNNREMKMRNL